MAKRRRFTPEFKAEVVLEALRGESAQTEAGKQYFIKIYESTMQILSEWVKNSPSC